MALPDAFKYTIYEQDIPSEVAASAERIYQSPFSVIPYFRIFRNDPHLNALVISTEANVPVHVLMYTLSGTEVTLLNELVEIGQEYLLIFVDFVFARYPAVATVNLNCLKKRVVQAPYPSRLWKSSQDIAVALPSTPDAYHAQLGKQTQKHITYYQNRLHRDFPDVVFQVTTTHETEPSTIAAIIRMNRMRMKSKQISSGYTDTVEQRITEFCRHYGSVSTVSAGGKIIAGAICYAIGDHVYLEAISHDPDYNKYNAGQVCLYLTIRHAIEARKTAFHMLWGQNEYKFRFLGVKQDLFYVSVYRSYLSKVSSTPKLVKQLCTYIPRQLEYLAKKYIVNRSRTRR